MDELLIGTVTHFFPRVSVAAIEVTDHDLKVGDTIRIIGHTSSFTEIVTSMEVDHAPVESAGVGDLVGVLVAERVRPGDQVYRALPR